MNPLPDTFFQDINKRSLTKGTTTTFSFRSTCSPNNVSMSIFQYSTYALNIIQIFTFSNRVSSWLIYSPSRFPLSFANVMITWELCSDTTLWVCLFSLSVVYLNAFKFACPPVRNFSLQFYWSFKKWNKFLCTYI